MGERQQCPHAKSQYHHFLGVQSADVKSQTNEWQTKTCSEVLIENTYSAASEKIWGSQYENF